ncbi:MAG: hypothetical protein Q8904_03965 [Bacteroidota bacterium]|nr:hypothetical protein [Bacteroidota bacterium]
MKKLNLLVFLFAAFLASCNNGQVHPSLVYEKNPQYTWGYAEFFGDYYANYGNKNNVLSLSLYTDSMKLNSLGNLTGLGQYLFLEDVFQAPADTMLQPGVYIVNNSGLPFTIAPGKNDTVDSEVYPIGAYISYYEVNSANSTMKLISRGSFTVSYSGNTYSINCNFKTSDSLDLKGSFSAPLPHIDQSIATVKSGARKKLVYTRR